MLEKKINTEFLVLSTTDSKDKNINNLYELALAELEQPLLDMVMQHTRGNQTRAALMMGINRSTLRKKLKKYNMN